MAAYNREPKARMPVAAPDAEEALEGGIVFAEQDL